MPSEVKKLISVTVAREIEGLENLVFLDASSLPAKKNHELRGRLEEAGLRMRVVKNRLARRAFEAAGLAVQPEHLKGATAMVFGGEGVGSIARVLRDWNRKEPPVVLKGGLLEGAPGSAQDAATWADLPSREELLSMILGGILAPATGVAGALQGALVLFPSLVAAHIDKMEKDQKDE